MPAPDKDALRAACTRFVSFHLPSDLRPHAVLSALAALAPPDLQTDYYGEGELLASFEREIAALLGKPAAVFLPSGTMAQPIAMRIWSERRGLRSIGFHPTSHLELHEHRAYERLHNLHGVLVGPPTRLLTRADLDALPERLAALLIELPQREIGGQLPSWDELEAIAASARARGTALHLDGARLWECGPFYGRPYAEIAGLFDSVYVSFYKGLGGIAGAALAGEAEFVAEARRWQRRQGGNLVAMYPYVISARAGLEARLGRMESYHRKAVEIAEHLGRVPGVTVVPSPPPTNMAHVHLQGEPDRIEAAALAIAAEKKIWITGRLGRTAVPDRCYFELVVGDATLDFDGAEVAGLVRDLLARAARPA